MSYSKIVRKMPNGTKKLSHEHEQAFNKLIDMMFDKKNINLIRNNEAKKKLESYSKDEFKAQFLEKFTANKEFSYCSDKFSVNPHNKRPMNLKIRMLIANILVARSGYFVFYLKEIKTHIRDNKSFEKNLKDINKLCHSNQDQICLKKRESSLRLYGFIREHSKNVHENHKTPLKNVPDAIPDVIDTFVGCCNS